MSAKAARQRRWVPRGAEALADELAALRAGRGDLSGALSLAIESLEQLARGGTADPSAPELVRCAATVLRWVEAERDEGRPQGQPLLEHLADFEQELVARDTTAAHRRQVISALKRFFETRELEHLSDLTQHEAVAFLNAERKRKRFLRPHQKSAAEDEPVISLRTLHRIRGSLKSFTRWLVLDLRIETDPFRGLPAVKKNSTAPTFERRSLTARELQLLLRAAPLARAAVYLAAVTTGLRRSELKAVRKEHLRLDEARLILPGEFTKNGKVARIPLPPVTVAVLTRLGEGREEAMVEAGLAGVVGRGFSREGYVFPTVPQMGAFLADLKRAGIEHETAEGRIDFHALRVTFGTELARAGVPLPMAQKLMRHSSPVLTSSFYTKLTDDERGEAVETLARQLGGSGLSGLAPSPRSAPPAPAGLVVDLPEEREWDLEVDCGFKPPSATRRGCECRRCRIQREVLRRRQLQRRRATKASEPSGDPRDCGYRPRGRSRRGCGCDACVLARVERNDYQNRYRKGLALRERVAEVGCGHRPRSKARPGCECFGCEAARKVRNAYQRERRAAQNAELGKLHKATR